MTSPSSKNMPALTSPSSKNMPALTSPSSKNMPAMTSPSSKNMPDFHLMTLLMTHKLDKRNYLQWVYQMIPLLKSQDLLKFVDGTYPPPNQNLEAMVQPNPSYLEWQHIDQVLLCWLRTTISEPIVKKILGLQTSKEVWDSLHHMFKSQIKTHISDLKKELGNIKKGDSTIEEYIERVKVLANKLAMMGNPVSDDALVGYTLEGLPHAYESFKTTMRNRSDNLPTFHQLIEKLHNHVLSSPQEPDIEKQDEGREKMSTPAEAPLDTSSTKEKPSKVSMLVNFLPAKTLLIFDMLISLVSDSADMCNRVGKSMMLILIALCVFSCLFAQLVDSYYDDDEQKLYHGIVTCKGLRVYKSTNGNDFIEKPEYKFKSTDAIHAFMSIFVFLVFAFSDERVRDCLVPGHKYMVAQVMKSLPLMVSVVCSGLLLILPSPRFGVGMRG